MLVAGGIVFGCGNLAFFDPRKSAGGEKQLRVQELRVQQFRIPKKSDASGCSLLVVSGRFFLQVECRGMKQVLDLQLTFGEALFMRIQQDRFKCFSIGFDAIGPIVVTHQLAG